VSPDDPRPPQPDDGPAGPAPGVPAGDGGGSGGWGPPEAPGGDEGGRSPARRRAAWVLPVALSAVLVLLVGGAVAVASVLRGGGTQPEQVTPAAAIGFAKVDLDPSAGQKLSALRFMRKFPGLKDKVAGDDLRKTIFEELAGSDPALSGVDYAEDVEPWLGQRIGVAAMPPADGDTTPRALVTIQVTDESKARKGLATLLRKGGNPQTGVVVRDGYALLAENQKTAESFSAAAQKSDLADAPHFSSDMDAIGEKGVSSGWVDLRALGKTAAAQGGPSSSLLAGQPFSGRLTYAVRFDGSDLEAVGRTIGMKGVTKTSGSGDTGLSRLPASTVAAFGLADGRERVGPLWKRLQHSLEGAGQGSQFDALQAQAQAFGFRLPRDLGTLLGSSFAVAVDGQGLTGRVPAVGARVTTDAGKANAVLDRIQALVGPGMAQALTRRTTSDGLVVATGPGFARALSHDGDLGSSPGFTASLPDLDQADQAAWVNPHALAAAVGSKISDRNVRQAMSAIDAVGVTATVEGDGQQTARLRVVTR